MHFRPHPHPLKDDVLVVSYDERRRLCRLIARAQDAGLDDDCVGLEVLQAVERYAEERESGRGGERENALPVSPSPRLPLSASPPLLLGQGDYQRPWPHGEDDLVDIDAVESGVPPATCPPPVNV